MLSTGYSAYRRVQAETSSSAELIALLYDALAADLQRAELGLGDGSHERAHEALLRAQEIVLELLMSVNPEAGDLSTQLAALYQYMYERLGEANLKKGVAGVREVGGGRRAAVARDGGARPGSLRPLHSLGQT